MPPNEVPNIFADLPAHADSQRHFDSAALARAVFKPPPWITPIGNPRFGTPNVGTANGGLHWGDVDTGSGVEQITRRMGDRQVRWQVDVKPGGGAKRVADEGFDLRP
jgi:hypothetical protein